MNPRFTYKTLFRRAKAQINLKNKSVDQDARIERNGRVVVQLWVQQLTFQRGETRWIEPDPKQKAPENQ